ncbi:ParB/RepB/Spo0J family partition protein [Cryobacterium sp. PH31-L1]|uniref:ParB/RepB/Spo0J family partition protein n=1 Tax=Cryobacterium sp. PH31-L1 TaxID=3046199 RepID=UPI0024B8C6D6|nr:ParB/RepB/Spo0J family partition protein [Cryobacterium sp. PH31-L1]MDJ0378480.1 ParB/RepB/Spo0J family partition protein [Cryobacterium sp. PH31-L1]
MTITPGHIELERSIDSIRIGSRHRTDLGDIDALAASIERQGLLQPITVTPDGTLICGARRLAALRQLGVRKLNVWVRSGISDHLAQLLAEQDDNALHKAFAPTEAAALYREVKTLLAEDAQRRQAATRFGSEKPRSDGGATVAQPQQIDRVRAQAALLVTGRRSYTTLERIGHLQRMADDESLDETLRTRAREELAVIQNGGSVAAAHERVAAEVDRVAAETPIRSLVPVAPTAGRSADLEQLAREALARAKTAKRAQKARPVAAADSILPTRSFVFLWNDLRDWWLRYDEAEVAAELTDDQWGQFQATLVGTVAFFERMRTLRDSPTVAPVSATVSRIR